MHLSHSSALFPHSSASEIDLALRLVGSRAVMKMKRQLLMTMMRQGLRMMMWQGSGEPRECPCAHHPWHLCLG